MQGLSARSFSAFAGCALALCAGAFAPAEVVAASGTPACLPGDPVVWVNTSTKVYHEKGDQYYGNTKHGEYECKSAADKAGDHLSKQTGSAKPGATRAPMAAPNPVASSSSKRKAASGAATPAASASPASKSKKHHKSTPSPKPSAT